MIKYPRIKRDDRVSVKIPIKEHIKIKNLRKKGFSYKEIAKIYNVCKSTIFGIINFDKRKKYEEKTKMYIQNRYKTDPLFRKRISKTVIKLYMKRYKNEKIFRDWHNMNDRRKRSLLK